MKVMTIVGARPQFVKAAVVSRAFRDLGANCYEQIVHTGQHFDRNMSDVFFEELDIPRPDHHLGIGGGTHGKNTGRMLEAIEAILLKEKPDWVLVYGDTDSTLAGALAAAKLHIPIAHVEAGLRSYNRRMPEELNRILTDNLSSLLFTPTDTATRNLAVEGVSNDLVRQVGDVMYDAALYYKKKSVRPPEINLGGEFILSTIHRAENTDDPERLSGIIRALSVTSEETTVVLPLHPRTKSILMSGKFDTGNILLLEPVSYLQMVWLLENCKLVVTDSGGLQKESYFFGKPCVTTREETEWVELVNAGFNTLAGSNSDDILLAIRSEVNQVLGLDALYGQGDAGEKIVEILGL